MGVLDDTMLPEVVLSAIKTELLSQDWHVHDKIKEDIVDQYACPNNGDASLNITELSTEITRAVVKAIDSAQAEAYPPNMNPRGTPHPNQLTINFSATE